LNLIAEIEDWHQRLILAYPPWTRTDEFEEILAEMKKVIDAQPSEKK
jgi:hypothetical protein